MTTLKEEDKKLVHLLKFGKARLKCAESKSLKNCSYCKETLEEIWHCKKWLEYDSAYKKFKRKIMEAF